MIHYGDITKISGYDVPIVDVVTFGAPCQDLSVAGKREGMKHTDMGDDETTRSGLFHEAIRIIKEMRDKDAQNRRSGESVRPRFAVYENVPGAFSSNKGQDFKIVLESLVKIVEKDAVIPMPPKDKWATSGAIVGDGWSIAWRVLDAQFWGVPQRRRRIALVADFGGGCAQEILFVRKGLRGDFEEGRTERESITEDAQGCIGVHDRDGKTYGFPLGFRPENVRCYEEKATTLCVGTRAGFCNGVICSIENHPADSRVNIDESGKVQTLTSRMGTGGGNVPMVLEQNYIDVEVEVAIRKYEVDCKLLSKCLRDHKAASNFSNKDIAEQLNRPLTEVEHWFRNDKYFAIPDADVWYDLKKLLGINTTAFDQSVTEFEYKCGNYDMRNRIYTGETSPTLRCDCGNSLYLVPEVVKGLDCYNQTITGDKAKALTNCATDSDHVPCVVKTIGCDMYNLAETGDVAASLTTATGQGASNTGPSVIVLDRSAYNQGANAKFNIGIDENGVGFSCIAKGPGAVCYIDTSHADDVVRTDDVVAPLQARDYKGGKLIATVEEEPVICLQGNGIDRADTAGCNGKGWKEGTCYTLNTVDRPAICYSKPHYIVRRLTPLECERLQGFADGWTNIGEYTDSKGKKKKTSDSARYKALGNSIAIPPWKWVLKRLCSHYERDATMASLFDGIGGFPCIWEQINGKGTALWASEIEDFPIAVTKVRIE